MVLKLKEDRKNKENQEKKLQIFFCLRTFTWRDEISLIKVAYLMLNFLNLKSFLRHLFFWVASCLSMVWELTWITTYKVLQITTVSIGSVLIQFYDKWALAIQIGLDVQHFIFWSYQTYLVSKTRHIFWEGFAGEWAQCRFSYQNRQTKVLCWWDDNAAQPRSYEQ